MTLAQFRRLKAGDQVFWTDPDGGKCSRFYLIASIERIGMIVRIVEKDGSVLECYKEELS